MHLYAESRHVRSPPRLRVSAHDVHHRLGLCEVRHDQPADVVLGRSVEQLRGPDAVVGRRGIASDFSFDSSSSLMCSKV